jgi:epoxide hydrolase-like predicted phosphatase
VTKIDFKKAIIFDFFDVIYSDPYNAWLRKYGYTRVGKFLDASQKLDSGQINMNQFFIMIGSLSSQSADSIYKEYLSGTKVNYEVLKIINGLRNKYKIGLLSNASSSFIREILDKNDLERYFDEIVISSEVGYIKPNNEIFEIMLNKLGVKPSEAIFIDDNKYHVEAAEKLGINSIQFLNATQLNEDFKNIGVY